MVCPRCIMAVEQILTKLNIPFLEVVLGKAIVEIPESEIDFKLLDKELKTIGFELIHDTNHQLIDQVKSIIVDYIHHSDGENLKINFSDYLSYKTGKNYSQISKVFSETENMTVEKFIILQKIEKVKELISYGDLNFSEIAYRLNYSSVSHLSKQFKKVTGFTLSEYKKSNKENRNSLDNIKK